MTTWCGWRTATGGPESGPAPRPGTAVFLGLGTNLGDREANLRSALAGLRSAVGIERVSSVYRSEPVGYREQPDFWNLVVAGRTGLSPPELLRHILSVERDLGRTVSFRNAPRVIDIDLLLYEDATVDSSQLTVPHPRLMERAFVLRPLVEVAPDLRHPITGERLADRLERGGPFEATELLFEGGRLIQTSAGGPP